MGLERVHRTDSEEHFPPARLGPQDLRDVAAVFRELDSRVHLTLPEFRSKFRIHDYTTPDIEDVLGYTDADTLPSVHVSSADLHLTFFASQGSTTIYRRRVTDTADRQAHDEAAEKLRQIARARQLGPLASLWQRGPGRLLIAAMFAVPALLYIGAQPLLDLWLSGATSEVVAGGLIWLSAVPLALALFQRSKDLIRLRGQPKPWWERRQGLIALVGVVLAVVVPFVIYGLESGQG